MATEPTPSRDPVAEISLDGRQLPSGLPRSVEFLLATLVFIVSLPAQIVAGLAVLIGSRGPITFSQERVGQHGRPFTLYKLRTMRHGSGGTQVTAADDNRVTPSGRLLRRMKLDELPSLWNVIRGDMSLVGPRPEVPRYVDLQDPRWRKVLETRPGLTDPVTLRLRNEESLMARIEGNRESFYRVHLQAYKLDGYLEYLAQRSWKSDIGILWRTLLVVFAPARTPAPSVEEIERGYDRD